MLNDRVPPRSELRLLTAAEAASYIADMLVGMSGIARQLNLSRLAHVLDLAHVEATSMSRKDDTAAEKALPDPH